MSNTSLVGIVPSIIDSHIHQWNPFTTPRETSNYAPFYRRAPRLLTAISPLLTSQGNREFLFDAADVMNPYLPAQFTADCNTTLDSVGVPVSAAVHVEAHWHAPRAADETRWLATLPFGQNGHPELGAIIGRADPRDPLFGDVLDAHLSESARFHGIRCNTSWHADPGVKDFVPDEGRMRSPEFLRGLGALTERNLSLDAYVYSHQLDDVRTVAREYPELTIILDHFATPIGWLGKKGRFTGRTQQARDEMLARWRESIAALAEHPNVVAKQSGLAFPLLGHQHAPVGRTELAELVAPIVEHTADVFGEDRIMFGSNFPPDRAIASHGAITGALADILAPRGNDVLRKTFHDNAARVYRVDSHPSNAN